MNPQMSLNHLAATATIAASDRRAAQRWHATEAARFSPRRSNRMSWAHRPGIFGALVALLVGVTGLAR
jgi:hypothetical protein